MFLILLSICIDFINTPLHQDSGIQIYTKKSLAICVLSGQCYLDQKGQSYCGQKGQFFLAKGGKFVWLFQALHHQSKLLFRRDAKPFSPLMRQSAYVRSKSFCTMVCRRIKSLLRKNLYEKKKIREIHFKISRFIVTFAYEEFFEGYATRRRMMQ